MSRYRADLPEWNAECEMIREAVSAGLVDFTFGAATPGSIITPAAIDFIEANWQGVNDGDTENVGVSPKSIHQRCNSRGRVQHPETSSPYSEWGVELARFSVPYGSLGVIKGFEQYLAQQEELQNPGFVYTQNSRWGIPGPWFSNLANELTDAGEWHFRLHQIQQAAPPAWYNVIGQAALPDQAYLDFPTEQNLWWPAGSPASQNVHLIVPSGYMLRVIYKTPAQSVRVEVASLLKGYIQSDRTPESSLNARTNW